ncbi:apoptosis-stimulating of p53 protein 1-like isoform X3 [Anneissia japonica]|uniref:apoptosis-stimulating of p53 protein 1-like isoform X3 n=2 Tax=Anneissia japonica TaxID=1529436 RepID=UPI001425677E|nr:apoptosis-stimulating of p53 protein 1-like isoform X3 [Anneissia japonica]XP_033115984.1 apoptosis-stimulating of p53 protein 1-like isoform X3 [Anneissia japonica]XP_033115985.1 apoptosis-stimulating of p53 protein 1-like isoform X3 [Anneissia japonica]XP_033115986.1 apoptosis-stimulating of p53 protein 1-like isoform X3 [Anneissia japonica]
MSVEVHLDTNRNEVIEVPVSHHTIAQDILDFCYDNKGHDFDYLAEIWRGCERPIGVSENIYYILKHWGIHIQEVQFRLRHENSNNLISPGGRPFHIMKNSPSQDLHRVPQGIDMSYQDLQQMANRQQQQIESQQQALAAKQQRLKFLKQQEKKHQHVSSENDRMRKLRERTEMQEQKIRKLHALRGQVETTKTTNNNLSSELEEVRSLFAEKEKELALAVSKVEDLTRQLEDMRTGNINVINGNSSNPLQSVELDRLRKDLLLRNKLNEEQSTKVEHQKSYVRSRKEEMAVVDKRIAELTERLRKKRGMQQSISPYSTNNNNIRTLPNGLPTTNGMYHTNGISQNYLNGRKPNGSDTRGYPSQNGQYYQQQKHYQMMNGRAPVGQPYYGQGSPHSGSANASPAESPISQSSPFPNQSAVPGVRGQPEGVNENSGSDTSSLTENSSIDSASGLGLTSLPNRAKTTEARTDVPQGEYKNRQEADGRPLRTLPGSNLPPAARTSPTERGNTAPNRKPKPPPIAAKPSIDQKKQAPKVPQKSPSTKLTYDPKAAKSQNNKPAISGPVKPTVPYSQMQGSSKQENTVVYSQGGKPPSPSVKHRQNVAYPQVSSSHQTVPMSSSSYYNSRPASQSGSPFYTEANTAVDGHRITAIHKRTDATVGVGVYPAPPEFQDNNADYDQPPVDNQGRQLPLQGRNMFPHQGYYHPYPGTLEEREEISDDSDAPHAYPGGMNYNAGPVHSRVELEKLHMMPRPLKKRFSYSEDKESYPFLNKYSNTFYQPESQPAVAFDNSNPADALRKIMLNQGVSRQELESMKKNADSSKFSTAPQPSQPLPADSNAGVPDRTKPVATSNFKETSLNDVKPATKPPSPKPVEKKENNKPYTPAFSQSANSNGFEALKKFPTKSNVIKKGYLKKLQRVRFDPLALLLDASLEGEYDLVRRIMPDVPNPSAANDEGITAVHNAICAGHFEIVNFLLDWGCDVNAADSDGWTPLHCAASCNSREMVQLLVEKGASIFATTISDKETAAQKCEEGEDGYLDCSQYLYGVQNDLGEINSTISFAVYDYEATGSDELSFESGDEFHIIRRGDADESEWWWARKLSSNSEGYVPRNFLGMYPRVMPNENELITRG